MTLKDDFFSIAAMEASKDGFSCRVTIQPDHIIYLGHFPGFPVTPGVVQLQILHELLEVHLQKKIKLEKMIDCKFLKILDPNKTEYLDYIVKIIDEEPFSVIAEGSTSEGLFLKVRSRFRRVEH